MRLHSQRSTVVHSLFSTLRDFYHSFDLTILFSSFAIMTHQSGKSSIRRWISPCETFHHFLCMIRLDSVTQPSCESKHTDKPPSSSLRPLRTRLLEELFYGFAGFMCSVASFQSEYFLKKAHPRIWPQSTVVVYSIIQFGNLHTVESRCHDFALGLGTRLLERPRLRPDLVNRLGSRHQDSH